MDTKLPYYCCVVLINLIELRILFLRTKGFRRMRLTADYIVTSISLADLITGINGVVIYSLYAANYDVPMLGRRVGFQFSLATSALNVSALTADRLLMIFAPFKHRVLLDRDKLIRMLCILWLLSLTITSLAIMADELTGYAVFRYVLAIEVLPTNIFLAVSYPFMYWRVKHSRIGITVPIARGKDIDLTTQQDDSSTITFQTNIETKKETEITIKFANEKKEKNVKNKEQVCSFPTSKDSQTRKVGIIKDPRKRAKERGRRERKVLVFGIFISLAFGFCLLPATTCYLIWGSPLKGGKEYFDVAFTLRSLNCILNPIIYLLYQYLTTFWIFIYGLCCTRQTI